MNRADSQNYLVDGVAPVEVVAPSTEEELCDIVASANDDGLGIIPWGGGTRAAQGQSGDYCVRIWGKCGVTFVVLED